LIISVFYSVRGVPRGKMERLPAAAAEKREISPTFRRSVKNGTPDYQVVAMYKNETS